MAQEGQKEAVYYQGLSASYTDAIRASDFKANIVLFFLSIVLGPVIGARDKLPGFLPLPIVLVPFLLAFVCLFIALLPRYPKRGRSNFPVLRTATAGDFKFIADLDHEITQLRLRCAILSHILFWKTLCLRTSFFICMACVVAAELLVVFIER
jgi:hypothetical protein